MNRAALARKYRTLMELRASGSTRPELARLAAEFPGALRELDELPLPEIQRRIDELQGAGELRLELRAVWLFHERVLAARGTAGPKAAGLRPSREALADVARELGVTGGEAHRLVFPFAHVRRGLP